VTSDPSQAGEQESRRLLTEELSRPEYNRPEDLLDRLLSWLLEQLDRLLQVLPGSGGLASILIGAVVVIAVAACVLAMRGRLRSSALGPQSPGAVLEETHLSGRDYRQRAARAAERGDWDTVLLDSYRALTTAAGERTLLDDAPTRTAHEVALHLGRVFPDHRLSLLQAAEGFDRVRYGGRSCSPAEAVAVRELDATVMQARPARAGSAS